MRDRKLILLAFVGGRSNLFAVYDRKSEFGHLPVAFIADQDKELFTQLPAGYEEIIWTQGYSIENDLYAGAEPSLENLMDPQDSRLSIGNYWIQSLNGLRLKLMCF